VLDPVYNRIPPVGKFFAGIFVRIALGFLFVGLIQYNHVHKSAEILQDVSSGRVRRRKVRLSFYRAPLLARVICRKNVIKRFARRWILRAVLAMVVMAILRVVPVVMLLVVLLYIIGFLCQVLSHISALHSVRYICIRIGHYLEKYWSAITIGLLVWMQPAQVYAPSCEDWSGLSLTMPMVSSSINDKPLIIGELHPDGTRTFHISGSLSLDLEKDKPFDLDVIVTVLHLLKNTHTGAPAFTPHTIAVVSGLESSQAINSWMKRYRQAGNSLHGIVNPNVGKSELIAEEVVAVVSEILLAEPLLTEKQVQEKVLASGVLKIMGRVTISLSSVRKAISMIDIHKYRKAVRKGIVEGKLHFDRTRVVTEEVVKVVEEILLAEPLLTEKQVHEKVLASGVLKTTGRETISLSSVRKAISMIDIHKYKKAVRKGVLEGRLHVRPEYVMMKLYQIIDDFQHHLQEHGLAPIAATTIPR